MVVLAEKELTVWIFIIQGVLSSKKKNNKCRLSSKEALGKRVLSREVVLKGLYFIFLTSLTQRLSSKEYSLER